MSQWHDCLIGFGANLGDLESTLQHTQAALAELSGVRDFRASSPRLTKAVSNSQQPCYLNSVFRIQTNLTPSELHQALTRQEAEAGRKRLGRWLPRTLDLDLLLYGTKLIHTQQLRVPHPRMTVRRFVVEPAAEIAGDMFHPIANQTLSQLLEMLNARPNWLVWVTDPQPVAHQVLDSIRKCCGRKDPQGQRLDDWSIELATDKRAFSNLSHIAKIVVWSNPRPKELVRADFAGPQIELPPMDRLDRDGGAACSEEIIDELQSEIMAAILAATAPA
jgi:2-amino-4-hydroxy-6-hydroxymethyldihydropteridine diphosphokinase